MKLIPDGTKDKEVEAAERKADEAAKTEKLNAPGPLGLIELSRENLRSRLGRELPDLPPQEAEDFVDKFIDDDWPKFLESYPALSEKPESEMRPIMLSHFEKSVIRPARMKIVELQQHKPIGTGEGEVDPIDQSDLPEPIRVRTLLGDSKHEARAAGFETHGLAWAEYKPSVEHLMLVHLFDAVWRGQMGPFEAFEIFMVAAAGKDFSTPTRENQVLSNRRMREGGKRRTGKPASAEALAAIRAAQKAVREERPR